MYRYVLIISILIGCITCTAQTQSAELSLAGVHLREPLTAVEHTLGSPLHVIDTPAKDISWRAGEREYEFVRGKSIVKVFEDYYQKPGMQSEHSSGVLDISIEGKGRVGKSLRTGRGLSLGDTAATVRKLYGRAPQVKDHIQIHWNHGGILEIDLDSRGKITEIELRLDQN